MKEECVFKCAGVVRGPAGKLGLSAVACCGDGAGCSGCGVRVWGGLKEWKRGRGGCGAELCMCAAEAQRRGTWQAASGVFVQMAPRGKASAGPWASLGAPTIAEVGTSDQMGPRPKA